MATRKTRDQNRPHASLARRIAGGNTCWLPVSMSHPDNLALTSGKSSESLIEAVRTSSIVPNTGLCGDCDCATRVSKAGHGNDRVWKAWKAKNPAFHPSRSLENPFGITTFPRPRLLAFFKVQEQERPNVRPLEFKGVVRMARHCHPWHGAAKDITVSQTMLRHAKPDTTAIYTHGNFGMRWMLSACT
jgi:hypothetical protein